MGPARSQIRTRQNSEGPETLYGCVWSPDGKGRGRRRASSAIFCITKKLILWEAISVTARYHSSCSSNWKSGQGDFILLFWSLLIPPCYLLTMILSSAPSFRQMGMQAALPVVVCVCEDLVVSCKPTQRRKVRAYMATKSGCGGILI